MKQVRNLALVITLLSLGAFAHDGAHGMKGTVTAITDNTITVETIAKKTETIHFDSKTTFAKSGLAATAKDLKVGDRLIIEAHDMDGKMHAVKVRFGKAVKKAAAKADSKADHSAHSEDKK
ncbi:MAG TPA: DUF5666 domain-containing protein [Terriglobales bacterium]|nr:DUF5666 domain-containing protein [Terriglobales bacterium]